MRSALPKVPVVADAVDGARRTSAWLGVDKRRTFSATVGRLLGYNVVPGLLARGTTQRIARTPVAPRTLTVDTSSYARVAVDRI